MASRALLIQKVIKYHFGEPVANVCGLLIERGEQTSGDLIEGLGFEWTLLRNCLLVLVRHSIVTYSIAAESKATSSGSEASNLNKVVKYKIDCSSVLARLRFATYTLLVEQIYGVEARLLISCLLKFGTLKMEDAVQGALNDFEHFEHLVGPEAMANTDEVISFRKVKVSKESLEQTFRKLVVESIFARVDSIEIRSNNSISNVSGTETSVSGVRATSEPETPTGKTGRKTGSTRGKRKSALSLSSGNDFLKSANSSVDLIGEAQPPPPTKKPRKGASKKNGATNEDTEAAEDALTATPEEAQTVAPEFKVSVEGVVFRVNFDYLNLFIYRQTIENFFALRWNNHVLIRFIGRVLLRHIRRQAQGKYVAVPLTFQALESNLTKLIAEQKEIHKANPAARDAIPTCERNKLIRTLDALCRHSDKFVKQSRDSGIPKYTFDWERCRNLLRRRLMYCHMCSRFGTQTGRVFNLLLEGDVSGAASVGTSSGANQSATSSYLGYTKFWNDQEVSDLGLIPPPIARMSLCKLAEAGFIRAHAADTVGAEASAVFTGPQAKHSWVFGIKEEIALAAVSEITLTCLLNILERRASEIEKSSKILLRSQDLSTKESSELEARQLAEDLLEASVQPLDQAIMILTEM